MYVYYARKTYAYHYSVNTRHAQERQVQAESEIQQGMPAWFPYALLLAFMFYLGVEIQYS